MQLSVLTPHRKLVENISVEEVKVPGIAGTLDILEGHANFVTVLETGVVKWKQGTNWNSAVISHGILEIFDGHISVMANVSELSSEIDKSRATNAAQTARQKIDEGGLDNDNFQKYELKLKRAISRIQATNGDSEN
jgi:F-type H+-transporting ATPase subunit epsilon